MSNANTSRPRPSHRIYSVSKDGDKTQWTELGVAWPHKDGKGFNLKYNACPIGDCDIVLRVAKAKPESAVSRRKSGGRYDALKMAAAEAGAQ